MTTDTPASPQRPRSHLPWFLAWVGVGIGFALGLSALGFIAVPLALAVTVLLVVFRHADRSALGLLVGVGLLSLYVAYVQRKGPGTVYWHTATASGSDTYLDPRPWLVAGIALVAVGIAAYLWRDRRRS
jgi:Mn2+/Fe2+ NRAMP family transporter